MTAQTDLPATAAEPSPDHDGEATTGRGRTQRWRWPVIVGVVVLLAVGLTLLLTPRSSGGWLDPESAAPEGSRAVAEILRRQGVEVQRITRSTELNRFAGRPFTLLVTAPSLLGPNQLDRLHWATRGGVVVLAAPPESALDVLAPDISPAADRPADVVEPECPLLAATAAGEALAGGSTYRPGPGVVACYRSGDGYSYLSLPRNAGRTVVLGQPRLLTNGDLAKDGNAALALHTLGQHDLLVWYMPDPLEMDLAAGPSLRDLVPPAVPWGIAQVVLALLVALVWRGRRMGPLVHEPLPVAVRAAETHEGRARLYRRAHARDRAAAILRTATLRRVARRLDLPSGAAPEQVADLAAGAAGQAPLAVRHLLLGAPPADDAELVTLADDLDELERALATRPGHRKHPGDDGRRHPADRGGNAPRQGGS